MKYMEEANSERHKVDCHVPENGKLLANGCGVSVWRMNIFYSGDGYETG